jgi:hypothetical protein
VEENAMEDEKKAPQAACNCATVSAAPPVVNALSPEMEAVVEAFGGEEAAIKALNDLLKSREESRAEMIDNLKANTAFTEDALKALSCDALQMLANTVKPADYSGKGGGPQVNRNDADLVSMSF